MVELIDQYTSSKLTRCNPPNSVDMTNDSEMDSKAISRELEPAFDYLSEAVYFLDTSGNIHWTNRAARKGEFILIKKILFDISKQHLTDGLQVQRKIEIEAFPKIVHAGIFPFRKNYLLIVRLESAPGDLFTNNEEESNQKIVSRSLQNRFCCQSNSFNNSIQTIVKASVVNTNILITGETGVGKTFISRQIHDLGTRKNRPFVSINCGAIPPSLIESELFGYEKGAFTGASAKGKTGLLESGEKGTVLLDEINELSTDLQAKLLHVIEDKCITRVGSIKPIKIDVRFIAATNKDLNVMVNNGDFREDLFYRLDIISIHISPLRERVEDIETLLSFFLKKYNKKYNINKTISRNAVRSICQYNWPGNIRELQNFIERMIILSDGDTICHEDVSVRFLEKKSIYPKENPLSNFKSGKEKEPLLNISEFKKEKELLEIEFINHTLETSPSIRKAALKLGVSHTTLLRKISKYGLQKIKTYS